MKNKTKTKAGMERTTNRIVLSEMDFQRIKEDIQNFRFQGDARLFGYVNNLEKELHHARVVPPEEIEADVVTMNSTVRVMDVKTKESTVYTLVYPDRLCLDRVPGRRGCGCEGPLRRPAIPDRGTSVPAGSGGRTASVKTDFSLMPALETKVNRRGDNEKMGHAAACPRLCNPPT